MSIGVEHGGGGMLVQKESLACARDVNGEERGTNDGQNLIGLELCLAQRCGLGEAQAAFGERLRE